MPYDTPRLGFGGDPKHFGRFSHKQRGGAHFPDHHQLPYIPPLGQVTPGQPKGPLSPQSPPKAHSAT